FAYVEVAKAAVVDTATAEARVTYTIRRKRPAVFGQTTIEGLTKLKESLIRHSISYEAGDPYDPKKIDKRQTNMFGLGLFRSVTVEPSNLRDESGTVDVIAHVTEGPPRSIKIGIGYGLEDQVRGQLQWQNYNFFGGGRQFEIRVKGSVI